MIRTFRSGPLGIAKDKPLPERLVVMPWGDNEVNDGEILRVNATTLRELPLNQKRVNFDRVALDFNHNTVEGSKYYQGEPAKVMAYASPVVIEGEGLVYEDIQYTPEGEDALRGGHYIDLSPAVKHNAAGEVTFIHSCAACRQGQVRGLSILAADPFEQNNPQHNMDHKKILCAVLGLKADATDEEIEAAAESADLKTMSSTLSEQAETIKTLTAGLESLKAEAGTVKLDEETADKITALTAKVDALEQADLERERTAILSAAYADGKLVPESAKALSVDQLRTLCAELPADQVPVDRRTPEHIKILAAGRPDESEVVRKQLNISKEDWDKHNA